MKVAIDAVDAAAETPVSTRGFCLGEGGRGVDEEDKGGKEEEEEGEEEKEGEWKGME